MAPEVQTRRMTADELLTLPDDGLRRHELVRGELRQVSPVGRRHGEVAGRVFALLDPFLRRSGLGRVMVEVGFRLESDPDTVLGPDVAFLARERITEVGEEAFVAGPPELAVEVVSPGDTYNEVHEKALDWLAFGARLVWVVAPRRRTVSVYRASDDIVVLDAEATLDGGEVVPGWSVLVAELFE
jgi:Uma2 family endonuclease